nr:hypothetical protein [Myxococcota bacterium]
SADLRLEVRSGRVGITELAADGAAETSVLESVEPTSLVLRLHRDRSDGLDAPPFRICLDALGGEVPCGPGHALASRAQPDGVLRAELRRAALPDAVGEERMLRFASLCGAPAGAELAVDSGCEGAFEDAGYGVFGDDVFQLAFPGLDAAGALRLAGDEAPAGALRLRLPAVLELDGVALALDLELTTGAVQGVTAGGPGGADPIAHPETLGEIAGAPLDPATGAIALAGVAVGPDRVVTLELEATLLPVDPDRSLAAVLAELLPDTDGDGRPDATDEDDDGDGVLDDDDAYGAERDPLGLAAGDPVCLDSDNSEPGECLGRNFETWIARGGGGASTAGPARDGDGDGVDDDLDNCTEVANADQADFDGDGFGNACDADFDGNGLVGIADFNRLRSQFGRTDSDPGFDRVVDANGDGGIGIPEFNLLRSQFGAAPGPAGPNAPRGVVLDPERYLPLDASGDPIEGELVRADGDGVLPPFEYRPGGSGVGHLGVGLRLRFPTGGRLAGAQGSGPSLGTEIEFTDAIADFGEGFPFQLDEPLELAGGAPRLLSEGPLDLASLAALLDLDPADPFDLVLLDEIEFPALDGLIDTDGSMAFDFSGAALGDEICLLEATFSIEVDAPGVMATLRADGGAGLFPDPPRAPLACDGLTTDDFTLAAVGFGAVFTAGADGFDLDVESGRLVVNQDGPFQGADQVFGRDVCLPGDGGSPGADLDLGDLAISFAGGSFGLEGSAALSDLGVLVPGVPDLRAALCTATLAFDGLALPELELATGLLEWATPEAVLAATITAQGWALSGHPTGSVTGLGTLDFPASGITVEVGVGYDAGSDLFSFSTGLAEDDTIALGDVAYLLDARFDVDLGTAQPGGTARVTGGLGLFPSGPLSDPPLPEEFELSVAGLDALAVFDAQGIVLTLEGGALQLPPGVFASDDTLCGGSEGPQGPAVIDLAEAQSPLTLSFAPGASPPLSLDGVLGVEHLAVAIDELPELDAALCSATLTFAGAEPPTLSGIGGALRLDRPELLLDATFGADLWRLDGLPSGVLAGTGTALLRGPGATFAIQVVYDEPEQRFRFATDAADLQTLALSDDAVVFDAGLAVDLDTTAPRGTVRVSGSAGLFAKTASAEQLDQFELAVSGLVASASFVGADFDLVLEQGTLRLPGGVFRTDDTLCGGANGPQGDAEIDVATADPPLRLQFRAGDSPPVGVFGSIDFGDLGVAVPDLPALSAALCDATLSFAGSDAPTLTDFQGAFSFVQDDFAVDASFDIETWKLDGLPGGVLSGNGTLTLLETGTVFGVAVLYDEAAQRFRFASGAEGLETVALHPDVVLFDVGVALDVSTAAPVGTVALTGSAGLFARTASPASPADFELSVAGFDALASFDAQGFVLTLQGGALQLPPSVFESDGTLCDGAAGVGSPAVVDLSSGTPLTISFDAAASPPVDLAGTIEFREIAVQAPGFPDLRGALCRTDLTFAGLAAPTLADVNGALALDTPDFALTADVTVDAWRLDGLPTGTLAGTGSFELIETGTTVDVAVSYDTGADAFRFATAVGAIPALPFLEDLALFDAGLLLELQRGASEGLVGITGSAGLFLAGARPGPPVPAPGDFLVAVSDLAASLRFDPTGFELRLDGGALALGPAFDAGLLDETTCTGGDGLPEVALGESTQVVATFPVGATPSLALSGQFDFANLGVSLPALPGLGAELCTATLGLDFSLGFPLPALTNVAGAVQLPLPDGNVRVALSGAEFDLLGFPTGRIALVDDLPLFGIEGFELALIGAGGDACDAVPTCLGIDPPVSGTGLAICDVGGVPRFELDGGVRLALPGEVLALESGDSVAIEACGGLAITAGQAPEIAIDALALGGNFRLGGPDGLRISGFDTGQLASVEVSGLDQLFAPNGPLFDVELSGAVEVPGGPRFALDQARFGFARDGAGVLLPPSFSIAAISFAPGDALSLGDVLPLSITEAGIRFSDPAPPGGLPALLDPQNLEFTLSAKAALPSPEAPFIVGQVEDLVASLDAQGFPIFRLDAIRLGIQDLPLGPLNVAGDVLVGGLGVPPEELFESIYFAGTVGGKLNGAGVLVNLAFDMAGVIGACLDVGAGPAGIPLGPSGFLLTGVAGGVAFDPEIVDPCDFTDVFFDGSDPVLDAGAGGGGGGGGAAAAG